MNISIQVQCPWIKCQNKWINFDFMQFIFYEYKSWWVEKISIARKTRLIFMLYVNDWEKSFIQSYFYNCNTVAYKNMQLMFPN